MKKKIESALRKALLEEGQMSPRLYKNDMEEFIEEWKDGMHKDKEDYLFVLNEVKGEVAMLLISKDDELFINEAARDKLKTLWGDNYAKNIEMFMPFYVECISDNMFSIFGVSVVNSNLENGKTEK